MTEVMKKAASRQLDCPCLKYEKPMCREGRDYWHFGNNRGTCDACNNTGYVVSEKARAQTSQNRSPEHG